MIYNKGMIKQIFQLKITRKTVSKTPTSNEVKYTYPVSLIIFLWNPQKATISIHVH